MLYRSTTDSLCFQSDKADLEFVQSSFNCQGMALQCALAPSCLPVVIYDLDKEPSGLDAEVFDRLDRRHCAESSHQRKTRRCDLDFL